MNKQVNNRNWCQYDASEQYAISNAIAMHGIATYRVEVTEVKACKRAIQVCKTWCHVLNNETVFKMRNIISFQTIFTPKLGDFVSILNQIDTTECPKVLQRETGRVVHNPMLDIDQVIYEQRIFSFIGGLMETHSDVDWLDLIENQTDKNLLLQKSTVICDGYYHCNWPKVSNIGSSEYHNAIIFLSSNVILTTIAELSQKIDEVSQALIVLKELAIKYNLLPTTIAKL